MFEMRYDVLVLLHTGPHPPTDPDENLLDTGSVEEARAWCSTDPAIAAGDLRAEFFQWYSAKGIGIYPGGAPETKA